jgi:hypothetical protein
MVFWFGRSRLLSISIFSAVFSLLLACVSGALADESKPESFEDVSMSLVSACDPGTLLRPSERIELFKRLRSSKTGQAVLSDFIAEYGKLSRLVIQWDGVSYSQVASPRGVVNRAPASESALGSVVCVHLAHKLPDIEHVADLAHELTHATRLELKFLRGEVTDVDEFVRTRLGARGGEADAFSVECRTKREILGEWDALCAPYALSKDEIDVEHVVKDLYNGRLSASLTGEAYPVMLARQYRAMLSRKKISHSALENTSGIQ